MSTTPAADYATRGPEAIAICITFASVSGLTVLGRFYTRTRIVGSGIGLAEYLILISWIFAAAFAALVTVQVHYGLGTHTLMLTKEQNVQVLKPFYFSIPVYQASLSITKASILFQYIRVFGIEVVMRRACYVTLGIITIYGGWSVISAVFFCTPIPFFWLKTLGDTSGHCLNEQAIWFSNAALNILTDIMILSLPMPLLNAMQLPRKQKIFLKMIFALGGFACVTSIIRLHALYVISISQDVTWDNVPIAEWTAVESNIGIMCACLPTLKPLLLRVFPRLVHSSFVGNPTGAHAAVGITGALSSQATRSRYASTYRASQRWSQSQASQRWSQSPTGSRFPPGFGLTGNARFSVRGGTGNVGFVSMAHRENHAGTLPNIDSMSRYERYMMNGGGNLNAGRTPSEFYDSTNDILLEDEVGEGKIRVVTVVDVTERDREREREEEVELERPERAYWKDKEMV